MFDNIKGMAALAGLMKNQDKLKAAADRVKARMHAARLTAEAGGGAARVTVDGTMRVLDVTLSPALIVGMASDAQTQVLAGSLIAEATNAAIALAQGRMKEAMDAEARELGLEGMLPDFGKMLG
jgi:DNA-binding protein YbaB